MVPDQFKPHIKKSQWKIFAIASMLYLLWTYFLLDFRDDHLRFFLFSLLLFVANVNSRRFLFAYIFFIIYLVSYDSLRIFPSYLYREVLTVQVYDLEKMLFGIETPQGIITANEYFADKQSKLQDFIMGYFYLHWVPFPLILSAYLFFKDKINPILRFSFAFLVTNYIGFVLYYLYPTAPPWYYEMHGSQVIFDTVGDPSRLINFDHLTGTHIFQDIYYKSSNVFGAIPSLHSAYPVIATFYAWKFKQKKFMYYGFLVCIGTWFGAVYSNHHYILDVILGILCAVVSILFVEEVVFKTKIKQYLLKMGSYIKGIR